MSGNQKKGNVSAGIGDPYWYEWSIGLLKVVEMLNPDSGIEAVAFQKAGIKGWDDVVIRYDSGNLDYYQVKHSAPRSNLTFSSIVAGSDSEPSLLKSLSTAWRDMGLSSDVATFTLITNRSAGSKGGHSKNRTAYPPLAKFIPHISAELEKATTLEDISMPDKWQGAWKVWQTEMGDLSREEQFNFLAALTITTDAPQLDEMEDRLADLLASSLCITAHHAALLLPNLESAILKWATSLRGTKEWVTAEDVLVALATPEPNIFGDCDVPTPSPFFPSRDLDVENITKLLTSDDMHRIVFLEADPGYGKTSVVSRIVNQRAENASTLVVDIRYYAYKPITPDAPTLPADADLSASPESLWYTLLSQIRERLRGRLFEQCVPVRNRFITAEQAREHVLRLAGILGQEKGLPFVIVIDGIDHAARAKRNKLPSLLKTLPLPETIPHNVRILVAGQPASAYPEYPTWLHAPNDFVAVTHLDPIDIQDIRLLLDSSTTAICAEDRDSAAHIIQDTATGNTLAVVFSVAEAERCNTTTELQERLDNRSLHSGVQAYYQIIWDAAIPDTPYGIAPYLSSALCLLKERITGKLMHDAFPDWKIPVPEWNSFLESLQPLVVSDASGYRVRHNDIRVFLEQKLRTDNRALKQVASQLSDYYMQPSVDPLFRHQSLFTLLELAGRDAEKAQIFNVQWVVDAAANGREISDIYQEAEDAFRSLPVLKDWDAALSVACGGLTLGKLADCIDSYPDIQAILDTEPKPTPQCLETERFVPPMTRWDLDTVYAVIHDADLLIESKEINRAKGLVENWFGGLKPKQLVSSLPDSTYNHSPQQEATLTNEIESLFEDWGRLSLTLNITIDRSNAKSSIEHDAVCLFEKGWIKACFAQSSLQDVRAALNNFQPNYFRAIELTIEEAAKKEYLELVGKILTSFNDERTNLDETFLIKASYWGLKALGQEDASTWLEILQEARTGKFVDYNSGILSMSYVAKALGWIELHRETSAITSELTDAVVSKRKGVRNRYAISLPIQASTMIGRIERMLLKGDPFAAADLIPSQDIEHVIREIWNGRQSVDFMDSWGVMLDLSFELMELCQQVGDNHADMILNLCLSEAEKYPVDQRMAAIWDVLLNTGNRELLRTWAEHWIGENGAIWTGSDYSDRIEIVQKISRLSTKEEWHDLVETAHTRLRHNLIGYRSHKEYGFEEPLDWLRELLRIDPNAWRMQGLQLLEIDRECDAQGGDNRLSSTIEKTVATASFHRSPQEAWSYFKAIDPETERYWLQTVRDNLIGATKGSIHDGTLTSHNDMLALWCCAVGLTRWYNKDQAQSITALRDAVLKAIPAENKADIQESLRSITPAEIAREEYDKDRRASNDDNTPTEAAHDSPQIEDAVGVLVTKTDAGYEPCFMEIGKLAAEICRKNPQTRKDLISRLLGIVDSNRRYSTAWDMSGYKHPLRELLPLLRESEIWEIVEAAVRSIGESNWLWSVSHNVHLTCLHKAICNGIDDLKGGIQTVFNMHCFWAGIPELATPQIPASSPEVHVESWPQFTAHVLLRTLESDSAETVSAALRGLTALTEVSPDLIPLLFENIQGKTRLWLLYGAEIIAAKHPNIMKPILEEMWNQRDDLDLHCLIQLWVCLNAVSIQIDNTLLDETFLPEPRQQGDAPVILTKPRKLMKIDQRAQGSTKITTGYSAAHTWLHRLQRTTHLDTTDLESELATAFDNKDISTSRERTLSGQEYFAYENGDMMQVTDGVNELFSTVLLNELRKPYWSDRDATNIAIAIAHGDDPWILAHSPQPSPKALDWPTSKEIEETIENKTNESRSLDRLRLLMRGEDLDTNQMVLGSCLRLFTTQHDVLMWYWLENLPSEETIIQHVPFCPSGRAFQLFLPDRFEPYSPERQPLAYFSGSFMALSFSTLEIVPAKLLQDRMGWKPKPTNPLEWEKDGRLVAKYERFHGPLDYNWSRRHMRQPTLSRWICSTDELSNFKNLSPQWYHQIHEYSSD